MKTKNAEPIKATKIDNSKGSYEYDLGIGQPVPYVNKKSNLPFNKQGCPVSLKKD